MAVRDTLLGNAKQQNAQAWVAGATAIYIGFPHLSYNVVRPERSDPDIAQAVITALPNDFQSVYRQGLVSGDVLVTPGSLVLASQLDCVFFGWMEKVPTIQLRPVYRPYRTDAGGVEPHDHYYGGSSALVSGVVTVWNQATLTLMQSYTGDYYPGQDTAGAVGRAMGAEEAAFQLFLVFPYQRKGDYSDMPPGYRFLNAWLQDDGSTNGSTARKLQLAWKCQRLYNPADGTYTLYDNNMTPLVGNDALTSPPYF